MNPQILEQIQTARYQQNISEALQCANRLVAEYPQDPQSHLLMGDVFVDMHNWNKAIEHYENALRISPDFAEAYFRIGLAHEGREDFQSARQQILTACRLAPSSRQYLGHYGRLVHEKGRQTGNINFLQEGRQCMEQALDPYTDLIVREQLAIAYIEQSFEVWQKDPENPEKSYATQADHLEFTRMQLARAKQLIDGSNPSINQQIAGMEQYLQEMEQRKFAGYKFLLKVPAVAGGLLLLFGMYIPGILLGMMAAAYYVSQLKPGYLFNLQYLKKDDRDPFIVRRIDAFSRQMGEVTLYSTSFTDLMWRRFIFSTGVRLMHYFMVIVMLPFEIIRGFFVNFELMNKLQTKIAA
jgi:tetratricopeptide (TPR) repeat protein